MRNKNILERDIMKMGQIVKELEMENYRDGQPEINVRLKVLKNIYGISYFLQFEIKDRMGRSFIGRTLDEALENYRNCEDDFDFITEPDNFRVTGNGELFKVFDKFCDELVKAKLIQQMKLAV